MLTPKHILTFHIFTTSHRKSDLLPLKHYDLHPLPRLSFLDPAHRRAHIQARTNVCAKKNTHPFSSSQKHTLTHSHMYTQAGVTASPLQTSDSPLSSSLRHMHHSSQIATTCTALFPVLPPNRSPFAVISRKYAGLKTTNGCVKKKKRQSSLKHDGCLGETMCASEVFVCASALEGHVRVLESSVLYAHVILFVC